MSGLSIHAFLEQDKGLLVQWEKRGTLEPSLLFDRLSAIDFPRARWEIVGSL